MKNFRACIAPRSAVSEAFRNELGQRLKALQISAGSKLQIWVMAGFPDSLHTHHIIPQPISKERSKLPSNPTITRSITMAA